MHADPQPNGVKLARRNTDLQWGTAAPSITEQVYLQASGFAMIMLWHEPAEDIEEENDERTAKERWRDEQDRWNR